MKPHQKVLELAAQFTAQAYKAEDGERTGNDALAMLHRGERDAFSACAQMADKLARELAEQAAAFVPADGVTETGPLRQELSRLWATVRDVDDRVSAAFDAGRAHNEYHKLFTREGSEHVYARLDKLEKHLDSLSGANEMHASVHNQEQDERRRLEGRIEAIEQCLRDAGFSGSFGGRQHRRFGRA